jgi:alpha-glucuronidase
MLAWFLAAALARADDGYRLWLRYDLLSDPAVRLRYTHAFSAVVLERPGLLASPVLRAAEEELRRGTAGLLGSAVAVIRSGATPPWPKGLGADGYALQWTTQAGHPALAIVARTDQGLLYGAFALLRALQLETPPDRLPAVSSPRIARRLLDHWDNLDGTVERGYAGHSIWRWQRLPGWVDPRYTDYARACASVGINGSVLNNVNADSLMLTPAYLDKAAAVAGALRPYGIRTYLSVRFSAPVEIGGLRTADPLAPAVAAWWRAKADEIYRKIPDFGGFLVKANSEGQPGPRDYGRSHAEGANVLADALAPHGGIVMWRAFVYAPGVPEDRVKQAYQEFTPLDGKFRSNAVVQIKNGPLDFQPREPFHPLFGAMPHTTLALELQITQEYLGASSQLAFLAPMWKETLEAETAGGGQGSTVAQVIDGQLSSDPLSVIAGVANVGDDRNWCGHPLAAANWYAFGRLAWDHELSSRDIAAEWTRLTFGADPAVDQTLESMLLASREVVLDYSMPLGLHHIMAEGIHYGPGPWVSHGRADWTAVYYHRADAGGIGFDRTSTGSNAVAQYSPAVARRWADLETCPDEYLLWFHHVPWTYRLRSGRTVWDTLGLDYQSGVEAVRGWQREWKRLAGQVDPERFALVDRLLAKQERDAEEWRDACLLYFQSWSHLPLPAGVEPPAHSLAEYEAVKRRAVPGETPGSP